MKLRNKILAMAVVAVAGVNVYLANDVATAKNYLSFLNLETIADAQEYFNGGLGEFFQVYESGSSYGEQCYTETTRTISTSTTETGYNNGNAGGNVSGGYLYVFGEIGGGWNGGSSTQTTTSVTFEAHVYSYWCGSPYPMVQICVNKQIIVG